MMRFGHFFFLTACVWLWCLPPCIRSEPRTHLEEKTILAVGDHNFPPYEFIDENGNADGFNIDILEAVTRVMHISVDIHLQTWADARQALEEGRADMITGMMHSQSRDQLVDFSVPFLIIHHAIFVHPDSPPMTTLEDLHGKSVIVQKDDIMHDLIKSYSSSSQIVEVENPLQALRVLASGQYDCALLARYQGIYLANRHQLEQVRPVGQTIFPQNYCFAVPTGETQVLALLNEGLAIIKETGEYKSIYEKWFRIYDPAVLSRNTKLIMSAAVLFLVLSYLWIISLRKTVRLRTRELGLSEERWKYALEGSGDGVWDWDVKKDTIYLQDGTQFSVSRGIHCRNPMPPGSASFIRMMPAVSGRRFSGISEEINRNLLLNTVCSAMTEIINGCLIAARWSNGINPIIHRCA